MEGRRARAQHPARRGVRRADRVGPHCARVGPVSRRVSLARGPAPASVPVGKLHWAAGARESLARPTVRRVAITAREQLQRELAIELNLAVEPQREAPLRMLIVDDASARPAPSSDLVLTWFHPLMDARGGENLLTHLNHLDRHEGAPPWGDTPPAFV